MFGSIYWYDSDGHGVLTWKQLGGRVCMYICGILTHWTLLLPLLLLGLEQENNKCRWRYRPHVYYGIRIYSCVIPLAHNCRVQSAYRKPVYSSKEEEKNIRFLFTAFWDHVRSNVKIKGYSGIARFRIEVFRDFGDWLTGSSQPEACRVFTSHGRCALHIMWQPTSMNFQHPNRPSVSSNPIRYLDVET